MTVEYTIPAIPTVYRGRRYRSRLEAKWAAFFDLLGWRHEYEPMDLGSWSPDFALTGATGIPILCEIKPIEQFDAGVAGKMSAACGPAVRDAIWGCLLLGLAPKSMFGGCCLGWFQAAFFEGKRWAPACLLWMPDADAPRFNADLVSRISDERGNDEIWLHFGGGVLRDDDVTAQLYPEHATRLWAEACNTVQWQPGGVS